MELDKRIKTLTDIQSVTDGCHDWELMNKKGYFADRLADFKDLKRTCMYGEYAEYREHDQCFLCKIDHHDGTFDDTYYRYFIPEDVLIPEEPKKKYRPFTLAEWIEKHEIGDVIKFRNSNMQEFHVLYTGYIFDTNDDIQDVRTKGHIMLVNSSYSFQELFDDYEICVYGEWQPFGIVEE